MPAPQAIDVQDIDHLGIVVGIVGDDVIPVKITHGYSRDHRSDLKQFVLNLITSGDGDIPLFLQVGHGNDILRLA